MSYSHSAVGHALTQCKTLAGSRMSVHVSTGVPVITANPQFEVLAYGISYKTTVCKLVQNRLTNTRELWVTPQHYSQSTQRHLGYFRAGFLTKHASDNIFVTAAAHEGQFVSRDSKMYAQTALDRASELLADVNKPRLREATRRGSLAAALHRLDRGYVNLTRNIALDRVDADTLYDLQGTIHFIEMLQATDDIDEVRAAVRAHMALNHPKNNASV